VSTDKDLTNLDPSQRAAELSGDEQRLHELGYAQELARSMSAFSNFAVSFTIISILSGCLTLYGFGMATGGPAVITWGWPLVGVMTLFVALAMAEVCSSYPTAGGLYYWAAKLAPSHGPAWSWFTGWFNFPGQVAVTAGVDFGAASFLNALLDLQFGFTATPGHCGCRLIIRPNQAACWYSCRVPPSRSMSSPGAAAASAGRRADRGRPVVYPYGNCRCGAAVSLG
jgi:amino acid transporter